MSCGGRFISGLRLTTDVSFVCCNDFSYHQKERLFFVALTHLISIASNICLFFSGIVFINSDTNISVSQKWMNILTQILSEIIHMIVPFRLESAEVSDIHCWSQKMFFFS